MKARPPCTPAQGRSQQAAQIQEIQPFCRNAIDRRLAEAVNKAVESAQVAYSFNPGSYTAQALSDVLAVQTLCRWLADLGEAK
jgi:hypothetical protein